MIRTNCNNCGKFVWVNKYRFENTERIHCSRKCKGQAHKKRSRKIVGCDCCGKKMERTVSLCNQNDKNFCSDNCYRKFQRKGEYRNCKKCGNEFYVSKFAIEKDTPRGNCCSRKCFYSYNKKYPKTLHLRILVSQRQDRKRLGDQYVKNVINNSTGLKFNDIPKELIELKRLNIKRKRIIKTNN